MDARREDGSLVAIKSLLDDGHEIDVARFLTAISDLHNHCVPLLDTFPDPLNTGRTLLVMPYLRPFNDPEFIFFAEVLDFIAQMLEVSARLVAPTHPHNKRILGARVYAPAQGGTQVNFLTHKGIIRPDMVTKRHRTTECHDGRHTSVSRRVSSSSNRLHSRHLRPRQTISANRSSCAVLLRRLRSLRAVHGRGAFASDWRCWTRR